ncbi:MAG TPA: hypothetical protein VFK13_09920 [Gemmatimonadaceae bacterium]|nr:hypothetical protein [Gemmatimonadaceae bacterium]
MTATRAVIAPQLVSTLVETLERTDLSTRQRVAALLVLVTYADSSGVPAFHHFIGQREVLLQQRYNGGGDVIRPAGRESIGEPVVDVLRPVLVQLAADDPNPDIRTAAQVALANLRR